MRSLYGKVCLSSRTLAFLLLAALACNVFIVTSAHAATYYVATNGSDSNPGTEAAPFRTIAKGSQKMSGGDTLYIRQGTYAEAMWHGQKGFVFRSGTPGAYTRYAAYPGEEGKVIIQPPSGAFVVSFGEKDVSYVEVSGLVLDGTDASNYTDKIESIGYIVNLNNVRDNRLLRNELRYGRMGISGGGGNEIIGNRIHHVNKYGIYSGGDNALIEGNIFHDCGGYGMHVFQQNKQVNGWVIRNNVFFNNGRGFYFGTQLRKTQAIIITRGSNNQFYNNLVYNNHSAVFVGYGASDTLVANNTVYGNETSGIDINSAYSGSRNARIVNNIVWGNSSSQITDNATNTTIQNNLTTDPKFVNAAAGDFGVQAGSPAIDKGIALAAVPDDFTGKKRPEGAAYDIGAFEGAGSKANVLPGVGAGLPGGSTPTNGSTSGGGLGNCFK